MSLTSDGSNWHTVDCMFFFSNRNLQENKIKKEKHRTLKNTQISFKQNKLNEQKVREREKEKIKKKLKERNLWWYET